MGKNRNKRKNNEKSNENNSKKNISFLDKVLSKKEIIVAIVGFLVGLYPILNTMHLKIYQTECETFYQVPGKYFYSNVDNNLVYLGGIFIILITSLFPIVLKKYNSNEASSVKGFGICITIFAICIGMSMGILNMYNLIEIMKHTHKANDFFRYINNILDRNAYITITIILIVSLITVIGFTYIDKIREIKSEIFKKFLIGIVTFSFMLTLLLMFYGTIFKISTKVEDKTRYEFITIEEKEYVVLSEYEGKVVVVPYEVEESGQYVFFTRQYNFFDFYSGSYKYIDLKYSPLIDKEK